MFILTDVNAFKKKHEEYFSNNPSLFAPFPEEIRVSFKSGPKTRRKLLNYAREAAHVGAAKGSEGGAPLTPKEREALFERSIFAVNRYNIFASPYSGEGHGGVPIAFTSFTVHCLDLTELAFPNSVHGHKRLADLDVFDVPVIDDLASRYQACPQVSEESLKAVRDAVAGMMANSESVDWSIKADIAWVKANPPALAMRDALMAIYNEVADLDTHLKNFVAAGHKMLTKSCETAWRKYVKLTLSRVVRRLFSAVNERRTFIEEAALRGKATKHELERSAPGKLYPRYGYATFMRQSAANAMVLLPMLPVLKRYKGYSTEIFSQLKEHRFNVPPEIKDLLKALKSLHPG